MALRLTSPYFADGAPIPRQNTCDGDGLSPYLTWFDPPELTSSFVLIMEDPDAPERPMTHWVVFDIPEEARELPQNVPGGTIGRTARNALGRHEYLPPCPPPGDRPHRYRFTLYAIDVPSLDAGEDPVRTTVEDAMNGHTLGAARLVGLYQRQPVRSTTSRA